MPACHYHETNPLALTCEGNMISFSLAKNYTNSVLQQDMSLAALMIVYNICIYVLPLATEKWNVPSALLVALVLFRFK